MNKRSRISINISLIFGILLTGGVFYATLNHATERPEIYLNIAALIIVGGGLIAGTFVMHPVSESWQLFKKFMTLFRGSPYARAQIIGHLVRLAQLQAEGTAVTGKEIPAGNQKQLAEGMELLGMGLRPEDLKKIFEMKMDSADQKLSSQAAFLMTLSKLGPGLGLVGTLFGMVSLLHQMGEGLGIEGVGPAMAVALCATLYGVAASNLIFIPLADLLLAHGEQEQLAWRVVMEGVLMIKERRHPVHVREALKAYLPHNEAVVVIEMARTTPKGETNAAA